MALLQIRLLGGFQIIYQGERLCNLHQPRLESLLAYLILNHHAPLIRQQLAFVFWPDSSEEQAHTNLRNLLFQLRKAWQDIHHFLVIDHNTLQWLPDTRLQIDVADFENMLNRAEAMTENIDLLCSTLHRAIMLYQGHLLPALYDEWVAAERERLHLRYQQSLQQVIALLEARRDYASAIDYAQRLLQDDPLREENYRCLMRLYALNGERASALRSYHQCVAALWRELEVEPSPATQSLFQRILAGSEDSSASGVRMAEKPVSVVPLVGRHAAWQQLVSAWRLAIQQQPQFALISGEPGIGKTRLASELVTWVTRQGVASAVACCHAGESSPAYAPVIAWLRSPPLQPAVAQLAPIWQVEIARLLPELLMQKPELAQSLSVRTNGQSQHLFEALNRVIATARQPLLLVLEDMQWCDASTLEWLYFLLRTQSQPKLLVVATYCHAEAEASHSLQHWLDELQQRQQLHSIELTRLNFQETSALVAAHCERQLASAEMALVYQESEGHPLFARELAETGFLDDLPAKAINQVLSSDETQPQPILPPKFRALLLTRLHRLSVPTQEVMAAAALISRQFTFEQLSAVTDASEPALIQALDEAWHRRIIDEEGVNRYRFSHDKLREVACAHLSQTHRHWLQQRITQTLDLPPTIKLSSE